MNDWRTDILVYRSTRNTWLNVHSFEGCIETNKEQEIYNITRDVYNF